MLIESASLVEIAAALRSGQLDLLTYVEQTCDRLDALDGQLEAFTGEPERRERLRRQARDLQARYPDPATRPPLYGVLVGIKDIFRVDGLPTRAGSLFPPDELAGLQASVVTMLIEAGALVLGKTVTAEFAYIEPGPTRNPHNLDHTPGGSSSGSAAAVAAGFCPLATGTQTIGSVIRPAAYCGVVGFKPSYGRIPIDGVIPVSPALDHVGLLAQDASGIRLAASLLCRDWREPESDQVLPVLGVPMGAYLEQASEEALIAFEAQIARLTDAGYTVRRVAALDDIRTIAERTVRLMAAQDAQTHRDWFARYEALYRPKTAWLVRQGQPVTPEQTADDLAFQAQTRAAFEAQTKSAGIDLWIAPAATGPAPEGLGSTGDSSMNLPWSLMGLPAITLPSGRSDNGLPLGLQSIAPFMGDERLLDWAQPLSEAVG